MSIVDIILGLLIAAGGASNPLFYAIGGFLIGIGFIVLYASLLQRRYRFCVNCAARLSKDVAFCAKCGAKQPAAHTTAATAPASQ